MKLEGHISAFIEVAIIANQEITADDIVRKEFAPPLSTVPAASREQNREKYLVYVFSVGDLVLKVGETCRKSGVNGRMREHYRRKESDTSTLALSIVKHPDCWQQLGIDHVDDSNVVDWLMKNVRCDMLLLDRSHGKRFIKLLESFLHCRLSPMFEGNYSG